MPFAEEQQCQANSASLYGASPRASWPTRAKSVRLACPTPCWLPCLWLSSERPQRYKVSCWLCTTPHWGRRWRNVFHPLWWCIGGTPWKQSLLWPPESHWGGTACAKHLLSHPMWGWLPNPKLIICNSGVEARGCQLPDDWFSPLGALWSSCGGLHLPSHVRSELTTDQAECASLPPLAVLPDYSMTLGYESPLFSQTQTLRGVGGCSSAPTLRTYCSEVSLACSDSFSTHDLSDFHWSTHVEHLCTTASLIMDCQHCLRGES